MAGFNFGQIGGIIGSVMDTDEIDIGRWGTITLPDGSTAPISPDTPLYEKVPCHISFNTQDSPDASPLGAIPIIVSLTINCSVDVDLQNADTITVRKLAHNHQSDKKLYTHKMRQAYTHAELSKLTHRQIRIGSGELKSWQLEGYQGVIGAPMTTQSRKSAILAVRQGA